MTQYDYECELCGAYKIGVPPFDFTPDRDFGNCVDCAVRPQP